MLEPFGVSAATEARFDLLASVPAPDVAEFHRPEPTTVALTLGQVQRLRGTLRHTLHNAVGAINDGIAVSQMTGTPIEVMVAQVDLDFEDVFKGLCDLEDALAGAWAAAEAASVEFTVPDYAPDPSL
jgi:hypothetical protein